MEKSKGRRRKKSPDQGAIVTMATVSAPAPLKLGEGVGLLPPSVPPPHERLTDLAVVPREKPHTVAAFKVGLRYN